MGIEDEELPGGEDQAGTTAAPKEPGQESAPGADGAPSAPSSAEPPAGEPTDMVSAIRAGLALKKPAEQAGEKPPEPGALKPGEAGDKGLGKDGKPKPGEENELYRMPDGLSNEGQSRFHALVRDNKRLSSEREQVENAYQEQAQIVTGFRQLFHENGVQPQELDNFVSYIRSVKGGDFESAAAMLRSQIHMLEQATGRRFDAGDTLAAHPDLRQAVDAMRITEEHALEVARARAIQAGARAAATRGATEARARQSEQERTAQWEGARDKALGDIKAFSERVAKEDIDWPAKQAIILEKVGKIVERLPDRPDLWLAEIEEQYDLIGKASQAGRAPRPNGSLTPLQSGGKGASGKQPLPDNMLAAIKQGLGY